MTALEWRHLQACMAHLQLAVAFVEDFCQRHGVSRDDARRLALIVEELFTNTVVHGHGGDSAAPVRIELDVADTHLMLRFEDTAPAFDPRQHLSATPPALQAEVDERAVGGLGLHLVVQLAEHLDYSFVEGRNRLQLRLPRDR
jgi:serine/threonine-protein kinase RsbW